MKTYIYHRPIENMYGLYIKQSNVMSWLGIKLFLFVMAKKELGGLHKVKWCIFLIIRVY